MDDSDHEIARLKAIIKKCHEEYLTASPEDKRLLLPAISETTRYLNRLQDQQDAQTSRSPANVFGRVMSAMPAPPLELREYILNHIDGSLTSLSDTKGFRNYVAKKMKTIGVSGSIQRCPRRNAVVVARGTSDQLAQVEAFFCELMDYKMVENIDRNAKPSTISVGNDFIVKKSTRHHVVTGEYSNNSLDEVTSISSADQPYFAASSPHSSQA